MLQLNLKVVPGWGGTSHSEKVGMSECPPSMSIISCWKGTLASSRQHMADSCVCQAAIHKTWSKKWKPSCHSRNQLFFFRFLFPLPPKLENRWPDHRRNPILHDSMIGQETKGKNLACLNQPKWMSIGPPFAHDFIPGSEVWAVTLLCRPFL